MSRLARPPAGECSSKMRNRAIASSASPCRRWIHVLRSDFGGGGAQSRLSFGAAVESWRVRSLCVQIRLICPHARPGALRSRPGAGIGTGSSTYGAKTYATRRYLWMTPPARSWRRIRK